MYVVIILSSFVTVFFSATTPTGGIPIPGCIRNGTIYKPGQTFQPTPCEDCYCSSAGQLMCTLTPCRLPPCVDAVQDPAKCCPICPNGENCRHSDGTIVKKGEVYRPDVYTTCKCGSSNFGLTTQSTLCDVTLPGPIQGN